MHKFIRLFLILAIISLSLGVPLSQVSAEAGLLLTKIASSDNATLGDNITYTYTIINNTSDNLTGLKLVDNKIGEIDIPDQLLTGANITATHLYTISPIDYSDNATELVNIATLTSSENITATATESVALNPYKISLQVTKEADKNVAKLGDVITYTYNVINNDVVGIKNISLNDDKLGNIPLISGNVTVTSLAPGENITAVATYKVVFSDLLAGTIKNTATVTGEDPNGKPVIGSSGEVEVSTNIIKSWLTKAEVLKLSGVPGKGIDKAPGLQKPFNPNSQASKNAGKKDGKGNLEKNKHREMSVNSEQNLEQNNNQEMNGSNEQNQEQEMNKNQERGKGKGTG